MAEPHAEQSWLWRMRIDLTGEIPEPVWPAGVRLHGFRTTDGRRVHALLEHGYRRGGGSVASFETWMPRLTRDSEFDPDLCFLVEANEELVEQRCAGRARSSRTWSSTSRGGGAAWPERSFDTLSAPSGLVAPSTST